MSAELTLAASVLDTIEQFLAEAGAPLTSEQQAVFNGAREQVKIQKQQVEDFASRRMTSTNPPQPAAPDADTSVECPSAATLTGCGALLVAKYDALWGPR